MNAKAKLAAVLGAGVVAVLVPLVKKHEGEVYAGYLDPIGIVTACVGHTRTAELRPYTKSECEELLAQDLLEANRIVDRCVAVPLEPHQRAAFISFAFNVGPGKAGVKDGFCVLKNGRTPTFLRRLNAGDYAGACAGLEAWRTAGGRVFRGLVKRRADERALCEGRLPIPDNFPME